jgi:hypothetical protein
MNSDDDDNISKLKFISKIQKGDKINIKNMIVQPNNLYTKINRSFIIVDSRNNTLGFLTSTVKKAFDELIQHLSNSNNIFNITIANNIVQDLEQSKVGLINLKDTYNDDLMFCCKIDTIIQDIDARLDQIKSQNLILTNNKLPTSVSVSNPINITHNDIMNDNYMECTNSPGQNSMMSSSPGQNQIFNNPGQNQIANSPGQTQMIANSPGQNTSKNHNKNNK